MKADMLVLHHAVPLPWRNGAFERTLRNVEFWCEGPVLFVRFADYDKLLVTAAENLLHTYVNNPAGDAPKAAAKK